jgi:hypothetical protein
MGGSVCADFAVADPTHPLHLFTGAHCTAGGVWTNASDRRLKKDIKAISYGLKEIMALNPVSYQMRSDNEMQIGFIAQEVQTLLPELVSGTEGDISEGKTLGLSYGNLNAVVVKAMQEQQKMIEQLQSDNMQLHQLLNEYSAALSHLTEEVASLKSQADH